MLLNGLPKNGTAFGDTSRIALMGISAGANLVAVITQKAKDGISEKIKLQIMNGLPADCSPQNMEGSVSYRENAVGYFQIKKLPVILLSKTMLPVNLIIRKCHPYLPRSWQVYLRLLLMQSLIR
jgi:hypothetical protein